MVEITASMVRELREKTDAPMMECKKALTEAAGDPARAEEILRVKLGNKAIKAASRIAAEGWWQSALRLRHSGVSLTQCEPTSSRRTRIFSRFRARWPAGMASAPATWSAPGWRRWRSGRGLRRALVGRIGENISIRRFTRLAAKGRLSSYVHGGAKIGVIVDCMGGDEVLGRDLAMHIAASKPLALAAADVAPALVQKEREIAAAKAAESGKPESIVGKMVEGAVQKFSRK